MLTTTQLLIRSLIDNRMHKRQESPPRVEYPVPSVSSRREGTPVLSGSTPVVSSGYPPPMAEDMDLGSEAGEFCRLIKLSGYAWFGTQTDLALWGILLSHKSCFKTFVLLPYKNCEVYLPFT